MLTLTDNAVRQINRFVRFSETKVGGLRVGITAGGCSGMQYKIEPAQEPEPDDEVVEVSGVKVFLDSQSIPFIDGLTIDFRETMTESGFVFHNPKATGSCGCGKSFSA